MKMRRLSVLLPGRKPSGGYVLSLVLYFFVTGSSALQAQTAYAFHATPAAVRETGYQNQKINIKSKNEPLHTVLGKIEKQVGYFFVYSNDDINAKQKINLEVANGELNEVVDRIARQIGAEYEIINDKIILRNRSANGNKKTVPVRNFPERAAVEIGVAVADITITGVVTDDAGKPVSGVSVYLKGTNIGTVTDAEGRYSLSIPEGRANAVLVFSSVIYKEREVPLTGQRTVSVGLTAKENSLEDVVVIGYGSQRRVSVTGSVDKVSSAAIAGRPVTNVSTALQGTSPNLIIQQSNFEPGQPVNINIRGLGTLGNSDPLVVIDGIVMRDANAINLLNPADVDNVSILSDAGTTAIYGSRAANGVILITTKKGRKNEKPTVTYNGIYGTQNPRVTYKPVSAWENAYFKNESLANSGLAPAFTPQEIRDLQAKGDGDWRADNLLRNARQQTHAIAISGGTATNTYNLSFGLLDQANNFVGPNYGYKRYNVRLNQTTEFGRFKLNSIIGYAKVHGKDHAFNASTLLVDATRVPLYYSFKDSAGNYLTNPVSAQFNPLAVLEKGGFRRSNDDNIFGNLNAELAVTKDLKLRGVVGGNLINNTGFGRTIELNFRPGGAWGNDRATWSNNYKELLTNLQVMADYSKTIAQSHSLSVLIGASNESFESSFSQVYYTRTDSLLGVPTTGTVLDPARSSAANNNTVESSLNSLFGRASYAFNNRYFLDFNFRYDGSSKFQRENRWGFFPAVSAAWRMTEESFLAGLKQNVGDFKLRASFGLIGNQSTEDYRYQTAFQNYNNAYGFNNVAVGGAGILIGNPDLTWEKVNNLNIGIDASLLKRRLDVSFEVFSRTTNDILYPRRDVPQLFGAVFPDANVAKVRNRGWAFKLNYNHSGKLFSHSIGLNIGDNLNELLQLTSGAVEEKYPKEEVTLLRRVGQPITVYYGYKRDGYFQNLDDIRTGPKFANGVVSPGDIRYVDRNGDGIINDDDKFILGNPFPRYTFGINYSMSVKGFDLMVFVQGVGKRDQFLRGEQVEPFHVGYGGTMYTHQTDYWTPTNPNATWPKLAENGSASNANNYKVASDLQIFDAAYARLKNLQVGYTLPNQLTRKAGIQRARIYFTGQNLLTLTKLQFLDPEVTEFNNQTNPNTGSNSARAYFLPVFYGAGIDITF